MSSTCRDRRGVSPTGSAASGTADTGYGMGLAAGDFDADGRTDLFVTNYGPDVLYRNLGGGRFEEG